MNNVEKTLKQLSASIAALQAQVGAKSETPKVKAAKKTSTWETVEERRFGAKGAKLGRVIAHGRVGGTDYVSFGKVLGGKTVKAVAVKAADLKAALADFDL